MKLYELITIFTILFSYSAATVEVEKDEGVLVLNAMNYDYVLSKHKLLLVYYYAPWCGHCKAIGPEFVKANQVLKEEDSKIVLAKVDCTEEDEILKKENITGYPTLKFFREGQMVPYKGGRMAIEMVNWLKKKTGPAATPLADMSAVKDFVESNDVVVIAFFKNKENEKALEYLKVIRDFEEYSVGITYDQSAINHYKVKDGDIVLFKKFDERRALYQGDVSHKEELLEFIRRHALPVVIEFNPESAQKIFSGLSKSHILLFVSKSAQNFDDVSAMYNKLAFEFRHRIMFVLIDIDEEDHRRVIEFLGLKDDIMPSMRIIQMKDDIEKYKPESTTINEANIRHFINHYLDGKVEQHFLTQDTPEDWDDKPVKILTGHNFNSIALDKDKDVLVEFFAPWCGHCKNLSPVLDELAKEMLLTRPKDLIIAKMDATVNELPNQRVRSFPTIMLYKKGGASNEMMEYNGERTLEGLKKFIETDGEYGKAEPGPKHDEL